MPFPHSPALPTLPAHPQHLPFSTSCLFSFCKALSPISPAHTWMVRGHQLCLLPMTTLGKENFSSPSTYQLPIAPPTVREVNSHLWGFGLGGSGVSPLCRQYSWYEFMNVVICRVLKTRWYFTDDLLGSCFRHSH